MPKNVCYNTIEELKTAAQNPSSKSRHEVLQCGNIEKLIKKRKSVDESKVYSVTIENTYDIIKRAHIGYDGRDRIKCNLEAKYANITKEALELFKSHCIICHEKRKRNKTARVVVQPLLSSEFNSRCQVDLLDMQSLPQAQFKWIMVYHCHLTKFDILRALTSKRAAEDAFQLLDIFLLFGAPAILQSDNGSEFTAKVISELKELWPQLIMVCGKPRHPQSQGSVERANGDIKDMLHAWIMADNKTQDCSVLPAFCSTPKELCSSFWVGLASSSLPLEVLEILQSEDDLLALFADPSESEVLVQDPQPPPASAALLPPLHLLKTARPRQHLQKLPPFSQHLLKIPSPHQHLQH
ncbi:KRAB-A domain-containing protein 2-like [Penaeus monodon]|uniref:KRAB-A domain-containing protein 2-like n=1 Tax=Penaeus monodon TaxID=6687 RepID=UPI0018A79FDD|nr:KRAB-A domain-containing protein 2-like [Penaeus monodon]